MECVPFILLFGILMRKVLHNSVSYESLLYVGILLFLLPSNETVGQIQQLIADPVFLCLAAEKNIAVFPVTYFALLLFHYCNNFPITIDLDSSFFTVSLQNFFGGHFVFP